ncbi:MAG: hypothetical protein WB493_09030, partial [Anaeromyxobacteraceae bacterium]
TALPALLAATLLLSASSTRGADPAQGAVAPLLPRSSVAAVLAQRGKLGLTDEQVKQLEQVDARLAREQETARHTAAQAEEPKQAAPQRPAQGAPSPGPGGPGGMSGGKSRPPPQIRLNSGPSAAEILERQLDDLDTQALLKAVESMPEAQREKAVDVASRYREQLFEQRERDKSR